eukprot:scaffold23366_cov215-Cylindrotheca_fusiformis.AAC.6
MWRSLPCRPVHPEGTLGTRRRIYEGREQGLALCGLQSKEASEIALGNRSSGSVPGGVEPDAADDWHCAGFPLLYEHEIGEGSTDVGVVVLNHALLAYLVDHLEVWAVCWADCQLVVVVVAVVEVGKVVSGDM